MVQIKNGVIIKDKKCFIYENGEADALLIQAVDEQELEALDREVALIKELTHTAFTLAAFLIEDWNRELSPWEAPAVFGKEGFGSGAAETLSFIKDSLIRSLNEAGNMRCYLGGYSLSGLFALWAAYQTDLFRGAAAVSPSVWFPGWDSFMESRTILSPEVYLSLGSKEEKTKNMAMSSVGKNIRRQYELLQGTDRVTRCELEWNPGNHFTEPDLRMAKGFAWLLDY